MPGQILLDFDGTIAIEDTTDCLLERFAEPGWRAIEEEWEAQLIGSRECMARQVDLVRASKGDLEHFIASVHIDAGFVPFVEACRAAQFDVMIVSDGLDRIVRGVVARTGLSLPVAANRLEHMGDDRWRLGFPHANANCASASGNCKCAHAASAAQGPRIVVGDGRSDFCAANGADYVFAKGRLTTHCEENGIAHAPIADLGEAVQLFEAWHRHLVPLRAKAPVHAEAAHG
ncbi:Haloacid Dehalogenase superfamily, subfamily IB, phosphoserine phosphatase-like/2,3-diketo-5-methylthio-1-phosphopentane phosphatase [Rhizobiales bacterium GAS113]|nr:Haloacid Dehalogenase superfamily, subfamily IB, phosphoserine phosphatase-like/2,3-diketo-5-methylthio-1-phosphopentane phosphatase [Rhizobiales bacterium GAS113]